MTRKNKPGAGRPRTEGQRHNVKLPAHVWEYLNSTGASRTITKLVEDEMYQKSRTTNREQAESRINEMGFTQDELEFIWADWDNMDEHLEWLKTASRDEIQSWIDANK